MGFFDLFRQADIDQGVAEYQENAAALLVDVRTPDEYREGHIPGSVNVPLQQIDRITAVADNENVPLFVYCQSGARSRQAVACCSRWDTAA